MISFCTDGEIRTPINGFGDRYSTLELHPYFFKVGEGKIALSFPVARKCYLMISIT